MDIIQFLNQNMYYLLAGLLLLLLFKNRILARFYKLRYISAFDANKNTRQSLFLDIRTPRELEHGAKIKGSTFIPFYDLKGRMDELKKAGVDRKVIIVCRSGSRGPAAGIRLKRAGFTDVSILKGGLIAWKKAGYFPSKKKKKKKRK
jgi:rhodanese-related sulfurtransferase